MQYLAVLALQGSAVFCRNLQYSAVFCSILQYSAVFCKEQGLIMDVGGAVLGVTRFGHALAASSRFMNAH